MEIFRKDGVSIISSNLCDTILPEFSDDIHDKMPRLSRFLFNHRAVLERRKILFAAPGNHSHINTNRLLMWSPHSLLNEKPIYKRPKVHFACVNEEAKIEMKESLSKFNHHITCNYLSLL